MTTNELNMIRMVADSVKPEAKELYQIRAANGLIMAFDLSMTKAKDWAGFYPNSTIEVMKPFPK